jgi:hypothetical protein
MLLKTIVEALAMSLMNLSSWARRGRGLIAAAAACALLLDLSGVAQAAEPLPAPEGPVLLVVSGNIEVTNSEDGAAFDRQMLYALGLTEVTTTTPWTDGTPVFKGVLARTVFERVGAAGNTVVASALNDYTVEIPMADFQDNDVLLATEMNGQEMLVSDKGPVWIVYPRDDVPALQDRRLHDRWVWQLKSLRVQ